MGINSSELIQFIPQSQIVFTLIFRVKKPNHKRVDCFTRNGQASFSSNTLRLRRLSLLLNGWILPVEKLLPASGLVDGDSEYERTYQEERRAQAKAAAEKEQKPKEESAVDNSNEKTDTTK